VSVRAKPPVRSSAVQGATIALSIVVHAAVAGGVGWLAMRSLHDDPPVEEASAPSEMSSTTAVGLELPVVGEGVQLEQGPVDRTGEPPHVGGGSVVARLDQASPGAGGEQGVTAPALNLADLDERMRLSPDPFNHLDRDQLQRLRVARRRQSWEDRRSTTHPVELTLLVTGPGRVLERRPESPAMPSRGVEQSPPPSVRGGEQGTPGEPGATVDGETPRGGVPGSLAGAPGAGLMDARAGLDHRSSAPIGSARPDVMRGPVSVPSRDVARPRDDVDSPQEVATTVRSLVHASTAGGEVGEGQGGTSGGGEPGAGAGEGTGSRAHPLGLGTGDVFEFWTTDPRLVPYFRQLHARIDPLWANAFPKAAMLDMRQGTVILMFTVQADGQVSVKWPPLRPSGIDEFDRNCADAIRRAAPLPPIPRELGMASLTIRAPFVTNNPVIR
jgi:TonB family protein